MHVRGDCMSDVRPDWFMMPLYEHIVGLDCRTNDFLAPRGMIGK